MDTYPESGGILKYIGYCNECGACGTKKAFQPSFEGHNHDLEEGEIIATSGALIDLDVDDFDIEDQ